MNLELARDALAEGIGTFALTFVGSGVICADAYSGGDIGPVGVALAHGLVLAAVVVATARLSGGHVNPAVTLAAVLTRAIGPRRGAAYVGAQLVGAVVAGLTLTAMFSAELWGPVRLGTPMLGSGVQPGTGAFIEAVLTFLLVFVVLQVAFNERGLRGSAGLSIGATLTAIVLVGGPLTGGAVNPARAFGPALASGHFEAHWVYWIGPMMGAVMAAVVFSVLRVDRSLENLGIQEGLEDD